MKTLNDQVLEARDQTLKVYRQDPARIKQDLNIESENMDGYAGREILELLQNAVDQLVDDSRCTVEIKLLNNILSVSNTGEPFSFSGIKSIMVSNNSPKQNINMYIGNKGLGFRSVLNWSNKIRIFSDGLSVEFSRLLSTRFFESGGIRDDVATLVAPEPIESRDLGNYVTCIELELQQDVIEEVKRQINQIKSETLLFLDNVHTLILEVDGDNKKFNRQQNDQQVRVECDNNEVLSSKDFQLFEDTDTIIYTDADGKKSERKYKLAVAYDDSIDTKNNPLYNFFATKINLPIKWHAHATFELTSDRNTIVESDTNKSLLEKLAALITRGAESLDTDDRWGKLESVLPDGDFALAMNIAGVQFHDVYLSEIIKAKILPLYNGGFISIKDEPVLLVNDIHQFVAPVANLLEYTSEQFDTFIQENAKTHKPSFKQVCINIKGRLSDISMEDRTTLIHLLSEEFSYLDKADFLKNAPNLFIDDNNNPIANGNIYLSPQEKLSTLPRFVRIKTMNTSLQHMLAVRLGTQGARYLMSALSSYGVHEYALKPIIDKINISLKKRYSKKNYQEYIAWLFDNRGLLTTDINMLLISQDGTLQKSDTLYFTDEYVSTAKINASLYSADRLITESSELGINFENKADFVDFLREHGVAEKPRELRKDVQNTPEQYSYLVVEKYDNYPIDNDRSRLHLGHDICDISEFRKSFKLKNTICDSYTIDGLDNLLKLSASEIATTLISIPKLMEQYDDGAIIDYYDFFGNGANPRQLRNRIFSYVLYRLQTEPWILINGNDYSPSQIVLYSGIGEKVDGLIGVSRDDLFKDAAIEDYERDSLIHKLNIAKDFSELPNELLYSVLLQAPDFDKDGKISKKIYGDIAKGKSATPHNKEAKEAFTAVGKLYTKANQFVPADDVVYTYKMVPKQLEERYNLLNLPAKQGGKRMSDWLGVRPINLDVVAVGTQVMHALNNEFQKDEMPKNRTAILAIKWDDYTTDKDRNKVKNIQVHLVKSLNVRVNSEDNTMRLSDYGIAVDTKIKNKYYIKVPNSIKDIRDLRSETHFGKSVMEIFSQHLLLSNVEDFNQRGLRAVAADRHNTRLQFEDDSSFEEAERYLFGKPVEDEADFTYENQRRLVRELNNLRDNFRAALFTRLKDDEDNQVNWTKLVDEYDKYSPPDDEPVSNKRDFDAEKYLKAKFPILNDDIPSVNIDELYESTVKALDIEFSGDNSLELDKFYNNPRYGHLLRFGRIDEAANEFRRCYLTNIAEMEPNESLADSIDTVDTAEIHILTTTAPTSHSNADGKTTKHAVSTGHIERQNAEHKSNGIKAEELVHKSLEAIYGSSNVRWLSGFAKDQGINVGEAGDGLGYDLRITKDGETQYIEVKSTTGKLGQKISFPMSANEYKFASKNKEQYRIFYVSDIKGKGVIYDLGLVFNLSHYTKEVDTYKIYVDVELQS